MFPNNWIKHSEEEGMWGQQMVKFLGDCYLCHIPAIWGCLGDAFVYKFSAQKWLAQYSGGSWKSGISGLEVLIL